MGKHRSVYLTSEERERLESLIHSGEAPARTQTRARILLLTDYNHGQHWKDHAIAEALLCSQKTVVNVRRRYIEEGWEVALYEEPRPGAPPKLTGDIEAQLTVLACSAPPAGYARWTMRLLTERLIALDLIDDISHVTVWERLKKTRCSPGG